MSLGLDRADFPPPPPPPHLYPPLSPPLIHHPFLSLSLSLSLSLKVDVIYGGEEGISILDILTLTSDTDTYTDPRRRMASFYWLYYGGILGEQWTGDRGPGTGEEAR